MNTKAKGFLTLIGVALFVAGVALWLDVGFVREMSDDEPALEDMSQPVDSEISTADWQTYRNEEYGFEIDYPSRFILLDAAASKPLLPYTILSSSTLYTQIGAGAQGPLSAPITIAVYQKPLGISVEKWIGDAFKIDVGSLPKGDVDYALGLIRGGASDTVLSFLSYQKTSETLYEIGGIWPDDYAFHYGTFLTYEDSPYLYEVSFYLPYSIKEGDFDMMPQSSDYINQYRQTLSTFKFTN